MGKGSYFMKNNKNIMLMIALIALSSNHIQTKHNQNHKEKQELSLWQRTQNWFSQAWKNIRNAASKAESSIQNDFHKSEQAVKEEWNKIAHRKQESAKDQREAQKSEKQIRAHHHHAQKASEEAERKK